MLNPFTPLRAARSLLYLALAFSSLLPSAVASIPQPSHHDMAVSPADPDKEMSELNHRIAGGFLLAIGLCIIASERNESLAWLRWLPPILFIAAGFFLAAWSDVEIWPRGELSWWWLIYDTEARQHKLYALLLIALGFVECMQASRRYRRAWLNVVFPILGVVGGVSLLFHHHSGAIVVSAASPPALARDAQFNTAPSGTHIHDHGAASSPHSSSAGSSQVNDDAAIAALGKHHQHHLTGPAAKIQREHTWFAMLGFCIALLKFWSDSGKQRGGMRKYLWANSVLVLGLSLLFYAE